MNYRLRLRRMRASMSRAGVGSMLVTHLPDVRYLSGFTGSNAVIAVGPRKATLFTDGRYTVQAKQETEGMRVSIASRSAAAEAAALLASSGAEDAYFDSEHLTVRELEVFRIALPTTKRRRFLKPLERSLIAELRMVKDDDELKIMQQAASIGDRLFDDILQKIEPGVREVEIAAELEYAARRAGAEGMSFSTIVASGPRSALPHGTASAAAIPTQGFVTLDFGVILSGYCSDMTRTIHVGKATGAERSTYDAVQEAQQAGVQAVRAGAMCGDVDRASRSILEKHKLAGYFTHSTGHGLGLEIHEGPRVARDQKEVLTANMVVTVEPGVYLPNRFGIRIEDSVVVEAKGARTLTNATKAWIEL